MSGPWEKFQSAAPAPVDGPWNRFKPEPEPEAGPWMKFQGPANPPLASAASKPGIAALEDKPWTSDFQEAGKALVKGAMVDLPRATGQALKWTSDPGRPVYEAGQSIEDSANRREPEYPIDMEGRGWFAKPAIEAAQQIPQSLAPVLGAAGLIAASPVEVPAGIGLGLSALAGGAFAGMQQGQEDLDTALKEGKTPEEALALGRENAVVEALGETAGDYFGGKVLGLGGRALSGAVRGALKTPAERALASATDTSIVKPWLKAAGQSAITEPATEFGQNYLEALNRQNAGLQEAETPLEQGLHGAQVAGAQSIILAPFGFGGHAAISRRNAAIAKVFQDPKADPALRQKAAAILAREVGSADPEAAKALADNAAHAIQNAKPLPLDASLFDRGLFAEPAEPRSPDEAQRSPGQAGIGAGATDEGLNAADTGSTAQPTSVPMSALSGGPLAKAAAAAIRQNPPPATAPDTGGFTISNQDILAELGSLGQAAPAGFAIPSPPASGTLQTGEEHEAVDPRGVVGFAGTGDAGNGGAAGGERAAQFVSGRGDRIANDGRAGIAAGTAADVQPGGVLDDSEPQRPLASAAHPVAEWWDSADERSRATGLKRVKAKEIAANVKVPFALLGEGLQKRFVQSWDKAHPAGAAQPQTAAETPSGAAQSVAATVSYSTSPLRQRIDALLDDHARLERETRVGAPMQRFADAARRLGVYGIQDYKRDPVAAVVAEHNARLAQEGAAPTSVGRQSIAAETPAGAPAATAALDDHLRAQGHNLNAISPDAYAQALKEAIHAQDHTPSARAAPVAQEEPAGAEEPAKSLRAAAEAGGQASAARPIAVGDLLPHNDSTAWASLLQFYIPGHPASDAGLIAAVNKAASVNSASQAAAVKNFVNGYRKAMKSAGIDPYDDAGAERVLRNQLDSMDDGLKAKMHRFLERGVADASEYASYQAMGVPDKAAALFAAGKTDEGQAHLDWLRQAGDEAKRRGLLWYPEFEAAVDPRNQSWVPATTLIPSGKFERQAELPTQAEPLPAERQARTAELEKSMREDAKRRREQAAALRKTQQEKPNGETAEPSRTASHAVEPRPVAGTGAQAAPAVGGKAEAGQQKPEEPKAQEVSQNATKERQQPESNQREHQIRNGGGEAAEAGGGNRPVGGGEAAQSAKGQEGVKPRLRFSISDRQIPKWLSESSRKAAKAKKFLEEDNLDGISEGARHSIRTLVSFGMFRDARNKFFEAVRLGNSIPQYDRIKDALQTLIDDKYASDEANRYEHDRDTALVSARARNHYDKIAVANRNRIESGKAYAEFFRETLDKADAAELAAMAKKEKATMARKMKAANALVKFWHGAAMAEGAFMFPPAPASMNIKSIANAVGGGRVSVKELKGGDVLRMEVDGVDGHIDIAGADSRRPWIEAEKAPSIPRQDLGSMLYQIALAWAHNNGKTLVGDSRGLTEINILRRSIQMFSSALRFMTTRHMRPAIHQVDAGLEWGENDIGNIGNLAGFIVDRVFKAAPALAGYTYDFEQARFVDERGNLVSDSELSKVARRDDTARRAGVGLAAAKMAIASRSLLRQQDAGLVAEGVGEYGRRLGEKGPVLKSETPAVSRHQGVGMPVADAKAAVAKAFPAARRWLASGRLLVVGEDEALRLAREYGEGYSAIKSSAQAVQGFYLPGENGKPGRIVLNADALSVGKIRQVLLHEAFHAFASESTALQKRLAGLDAQLRRIMDNPNESEAAWAAEALRRVNAAGVEGTARVEEFGAYAVEAWEKSPASLSARVRKWVVDFVSVVRMALARMGLYSPATVTPADLAALARDWLRRGAVSDRREGAASALERQSQRGPWYYSALTRAIASAKQPKAPAAQWKAIIAKLPGVKQEEIDWSGVNGWLDSQAGAVDKQALVNYVRSQEVDIQEIELGKPREQLLGDTFSINVEEHTDYDDNTGEPIFEEKTLVAHLAEDKHGLYWEFDNGEADDARFGSLDEAREYAESAWSGSSWNSDFSLSDDEYRINGEPKFDEYIETGGKEGSYRELLLTIPTKNRKAWEIRWNDTGDIFQSYSDKRSAAAQVGFMQDRGDPVSLREVSVPDEKGAYRSTHYDEPNILAHVRFDEREDKDGGRVLHVAEVQSDWHQQGRKKGYGIRNKQGKYWNVFTSDGDLLAEGIFALTESEAKDKFVQDYPSDAMRDALVFSVDEDSENELENGVDTVSEGVPNAPFKQSWPMLAMKRMIRYAAENGFDAITWDVGATQADRYNLSQQVHRIDVSVGEGGNREVAVVLRENGSIVSMEVDRNGTVVKGDAALDANGKPLGEVIGKEMAEKVMAVDASDSFYEQDMRVGGQGMLGFYDRILPMEVGKYVKKLGGSVDRTTVSGNVPAWRINLIEKMKETAMEGQPLFSRLDVAGRIKEDRDAQGRLLAPNGQPSKLNARQWRQVRTPAFKAWFGDWENDPKNSSKVVDEKGEPLVVYHGTHQGDDFSVFDAEAHRDEGRRTTIDSGIFFSADRDFSSSYANHAESGRVIPVFLNIRDMWSGSDKNAIRHLAYAYEAKYGETLPVSIQERARKGWWGAVEGLTQRLRENGGYDGIELFEGGGQNFMVFDSEQIKSATGNAGAFSPDNPDIRYSGAASSRRLASMGTAQAVRAELAQAGFGADVAKLEKAGLLRIVSYADAPDFVGPNDAAAFAGGKAWLVYDHIEPGEAVGKFLHEIGEHAALETMLGAKLYADLSEQFDALAQAGDKWALQAADRVPKATPERHVASERLAYLVEAVANADEKARASMPNRLKLLVKRVVAALRAWFYLTPFYRALAARGMGFQLSARDIAALARAAARYYAAGTGQEGLRVEGARASSRLEGAAPEEEQRLAPNGKPSKLNAVQKLDKQIPATEDGYFYAYRGASSFSKRSDSGVYFTIDPLLAHKYARTNGDIQRIVLNKNRLIDTRRLKSTPETNDFKRLFKSYGIKEYAEFSVSKESRLTHVENFNLLFDIADENGYDGYIGFEGGSPSIMLTPKSYEAIFDSSEIESKDVVDFEIWYRGQVPKHNPDIRFSKRAGQEPSPAERGGIEDDPAAVFAEIDAAVPAGGRFAGARQGLKELFGQMDAKAKRGALGLLTVKQVVEVGRRLLPRLADYQRQQDRMAVTRSRVIGGWAKGASEVERLGADGIAVEHSKLEPKEMNRLAHTMHEATIAGVDPSVDYAPSIGLKEAAKRISLLREQMRQRGGQPRGQGVKTVSDLQADEEALRKQMAFEHSRLKDKDRIQALWQGLTPEARRIFILERDFHLHMSRQVEAALIDMIQQSEMGGKQRRESIAKLRKDFESQRVQAPYFPLYRDGDFWVALQGPDKPGRGPVAALEVLPNGSAKATNRRGLNKDEVQRLKDHGGRYDKKEKAWYFANEERATRALGELLKDPGPQPGDKEFHLFRTAKQQAEFIVGIKNNKSAGTTVAGSGVKLDNLKEVMGASAGFVADVEDILSGLGDSQDVQGARDAVWQLYLRTLPDMSSRKHMIHRKKTAGFGKDALLAFSHKAAHDAYGLARLKHAPEMRRILGELKKDLAVAESPKARAKAQERLDVLKFFQDHVMGKLTGDEVEKKAFALEQRFINGEEAVKAEMERWKQLDEIMNDWAKAGDMPRRVERDINTLEGRLGAVDKILGEEDGKQFAAYVISEMQQAHDALMNPKTNPLTVMANQLGYLYTMAFSPAAWIVNVFQTPVKSMPYVASKFGAKDTTAAFTRAYKLAFGAGKAKKSKGESRLSVRGALSVEEAAAYDLAEESGRIDNTRAHDLMGFAEEGANRSGVARKWAMATAFGFHETERLNREVTFIAAFDLARKTMRFEDAVDYAEQVLDRTHLDYTAGNRARIMRGGLARVALQFKSYSQGMMYQWLRSAWEAFGRTATPEQKAEARRYLLMQVGVQMAFAGALGLPVGGLLWAAKHALDGDGDDPEEFEAELRQALADWFGVKGGESIAKGLLNAVGPADFASRLSEADMLWRDSDRELEGKDSISNIVYNLAGPSIGIVGQWADAARLMGDGHFERGLEKFMPKFLASLLKALRYGTEGVKTLKGDELIDDTSPGEVMAQALGFTPARLSERYDENTATMNVQKRILARRSDLIEMARNAMLARDADANRAAFDKIRAFNRAQPEKAIKRTDVVASARQFAKNRMRAEHGLVLDRRLQGKLGGRYGFAE